MKTTIEISDALLTAARRQARVRGLTLRALVEEGLRLVLREEITRGTFRLRRATFKGVGLAEGASDSPTVLDTIYRGRGS